MRIVILALFLTFLLNPVLFATIYEFPNDKVKAPYWEIFAPKNIQEFQINQLLEQIDLFLPEGWGDVQIHGIRAKFKGLPKEITLYSAGERLLDLQGNTLSIKITNKSELSKLIVISEGYEDEINGSPANFYKISGKLKKSTDFEMPVESSYGKIYQQVTRKSGGEKLEEEINVNSRHITINVLSHTVQIHDLTVYLDDGTTLSLDDLLSLSGKNKASYGKGILKVNGKNSMKLLFGKAPQLVTGYSVQAESYGGHADVEVVLGKPQEIEGPLCNDQVMLDLNSQLNQCINSKNGIISSIGTLVESIGDIQIRPKGREEKYAACTERRGKVVFGNKELNSKANSLTDEVSKITGKIRAKRKKIKEIKNYPSSWRCTVKGRGRTVVDGFGVTNGQALMNAIRKCGIMCQKGWRPTSDKFDCFAN